MYTVIDCHRLSFLTDLHSELAAIAAIYCHNEFKTLTAIGRRRLAAGAAAPESCALGAAGLVPHSGALEFVLDLTDTERSTVHLLGAASARRSVEQLLPFGDTQFGADAWPETPVSEG